MFEKSRSFIVNIVESIGFQPEQDGSNKPLNSTKQFQTMFQKRKKQFGVFNKEKYFSSIL